MRRIFRIFLTLILILSISHYLIQGVFKSMLGFNVDFVVYYSAAKVVKCEGKLYDNALLLEIERGSGLPESEGVMPYQYPPLFAILMLPFAFLRYTHAKLLWLFLNQFFLAGALLFTWGSIRDKISYAELLFVLFLFLNFDPILSNLNLGQINILVFFLISGSFYLFKKGKDVSSGVLLAFATMFRITPGLLIIYFLWKREYRIFFSALFSLIILSLISVALIGINAHYLYVIDVLLPIAWDKAGHPSNQSYSGFFLRLFDGLRLARGLTMIASFATLILTGFYCSSKKETNRDNFCFNLEFSLVIITIFLISNITWEHHLVWLLFPFVTAFWYLIERIAVKREIFLTIALVLSYTFIALQFDYKDPRLAQGIFILAMSPRLYGILILWWIFAYILSKSQSKVIKDGI